MPGVRAHDEQRAAQERRPGALLGRRQARGSRASVPRDPRRQARQEGAAQAVRQRGRGQPALVAGVRSPRADHVPHPGVRRCDQGLHDGAEERRERGPRRSPTRHRTPHAAIARRAVSRKRPIGCASAPIPDRAACCSRTTPTSRRSRSTRRQPARLGRTNAALRRAPSTVRAVALATDRSSGKSISVGRKASLAMLSVRDDRRRRAAARSTSSRPSRDEKRCAFVGAAAAIDEHEMRHARARRTSRAASEARPRTSADLTPYFLPVAGLILEELLHRNRVDAHAAVRGSWAFRSSRRCALRVRSSSQVAQVLERLDARSSSAAVVVRRNQDGLARREGLRTKRSRFGARVFLACSNRIPIAGFRTSANAHKVPTTIVPHRDVDARSATTPANSASSTVNGSRYRT